MLSRMSRFIEKWTLRWWFRAGHVLLKLEKCKSCLKVHRSVSIQLFQRSNAIFSFPDITRYHEWFPSVKGIELCTLRSRSWMAKPFGSSDWDWDWQAAIALVSQPFGYHQTTTTTTTVFCSQQWCIGSGRCGAVSVWLQVWLIGWIEVGKLPGWGRVGQRYRSRWDRYPLAGWLAQLGLVVWFGGWLTGGNSSNRLAGSREWLWLGLTVRTVWLRGITRRGIWG